jgi:hypothetical protein
MQVTCKECILNVFIKDCIFKLSLKDCFKQLFYEVFSLKTYLLNPNSISFMQATPSCYAYKVLLNKNIFYLGNLLFTVFKDYFEFYKKFESGLSRFEAFMQIL